MVAGEFDLVIAEEYPGQPLPRLREADRTDLLHDELVLATPSSWGARTIGDLAARPFVMEPAGTTAGQWALALCRAAGFEPDVRYISTDLNIHLRLIREGLAGGVLPGLASAGGVPGLAVLRLDDHPARCIFSAVRRGASGRPAVRAFAEAIATSSSTR